MVDTEPYIDVTFKVNHFYFFSSLCTMQYAVQQHLINKTVAEAANALYEICEGKFFY